MFWQQGQKTVTGTCGIVAGAFPALGADIPTYAPTMPWDGAGWETRASVWVPEMHQDLQGWAGLSSAPAWPPQTVKAERSEDHCRTAMTKGLNLAALITASVGPVAHLKAEWSVLPVSYVTHQDNGLFAFLSTSLCKDDKFIVSNCEAFVQSGGVSTWLEGSFARINPERKRRQGFRFWWNVLTDILSWSTFAKGLWLKEVFVVNIAIWDSKEVAELLPCVLNLIPCRNPSDRLWLVEWVRLIMIWIIYITEIFLWGFSTSYWCLSWTFSHNV